MEISRDEEKILAVFRRLPPEGKAEAIDYVNFLLGKHLPSSSQEQPEGHCRLEKNEQRPEAKKEPIFTE